jgi:hypothetical protein
LVESALRPNSEARNLRAPARTPVDDSGDVSSRVAWPGVSSDEEAPRERERVVGVSKNRPPQPATLSPADRTRACGRRRGMKLRKRARECSIMLSPSSREPRTQAGANAVAGDWRTSETPGSVWRSECQRFGRTSLEWVMSGRIVGAFATNQAVSLKIPDSGGRAIVAPAKSTRSDKFSRSCGSAACVCSR